MIDLNMNKGLRSVGGWKFRDGMWYTKNLKNNTGFFNLICLTIVPVKVEFLSTDFFGGSNNNKTNNPR